MFRHQLHCLPLGSLVGSVHELQVLVKEPLQLEQLNHSCYRIPLVSYQTWDRSCGIILLILENLHINQPELKGDDLQFQPLKDLNICMCNNTRSEYCATDPA